MVAVRNPVARSGVKARQDVEGKIERGNRSPHANDEERLNEQTKRDRCVELGQAFLNGCYTNAS
jgi:hypothetical protein